MKVLIKGGIIICVFLLIAVSLVYAEIIWSNPSLTSWKITSSNPRCDTLDEPVGWWEFLDSAHTIFDKKTWNSPDYNCSRWDGMEMFGTTAKTECCPASYTCSPAVDASGNRKCAQNLEIDMCEDYTTRDSCLNDTNNVAILEIESIEGEGFCQNYTGNYGVCFEQVACRCSWDETRTTNKCRPVAKHQECKPIDAGGSECKNFSEFSDAAGNFDLTKFQDFCGVTEHGLIGNCDLHIQDIDECNTTGRLVRSWTAEWTGEPSLAPATCKPGTRNFPCGTQLSFFGIAGLIIAVLIIIIFYVLVLRKKKKFSGKKRRK